MAAGDTKLSIPKVSFETGKQVIIEYRHRIIAKNVAAELSKGNTLDLSWDEFKALTTRGERTALKDVFAKLRAHVKATVKHLADAIEE